MTPRTVLSRAALAACLALALTACGDPLTTDNYVQLKGGMTIEEVEAVLGKGTELDALTSGLAGGSMGVKRLEWRAGDKLVRVTFQDGEEVWGTIDGSPDDGIGFFLVPADKGDNNVRMFVVRSALKELRLVT